ncbi:MAG: LamG domain-containing protein, partial [Bdellovibrionales bacterium]|nr:LamG domain-containing protein [Bdellovibrionales bacterium]
FMQDAASGRTTSTNKWMSPYLYYSGPTSYITASVRISGTQYTASTSGALGTFTKRWVHVCSTFDKTLGSSRLKLYVDGVSVGSHNATNADIDAGGFPEMGRWQANSTYFDGEMDEVSLWHRALSASEIANMYKIQKSAYTGIYTSDVMDAGSAQDWKVLNWDPYSPYLKNMPASGGREGGYISRNVAMTNTTRDNELLLHLDETGTPTSFADASGLSNNFGCTNCPTPTTGLLDGAMTFDGTNDAIYYNHSSINDNTQWTISLWINPDHEADNTKATVPVFKKVSLTDAYSTFSFSRDHMTPGKENTWRFHTGTTWKEAKYNGNIPKGKWSHIVATFDGSVMKTYLNGIYDNQIAGTPITGGQRLYIGSGADNTTSYNYFSGKIDEVALWNKALTDSEIFDVYHRAANRVQIQIRSCPDPTCSTNPSFVGAAGDSSKYFSELMNTSLGLPSLSIIGAVPTNRYFQYRLYLESDGSTTTPQVNNIRVFSE